MCSADSVVHGDILAAYALVVWVLAFHDASGRTRKSLGGPASRWAEKGSTGHNAVAQRHDMDSLAEMLPKTASLLT